MLVGKHLISTRAIAFKIFVHAYLPNTRGKTTEIQVLCKQLFSFWVFFSVLAQISTKINANSNGTHVASSFGGGCCTTIVGILVASSWHYRKSVNRKAPHRTAPHRMYLVEIINEFVAILLAGNRNLSSYWIHLICAACRKLLCRFLVFVIIIIIVVERSKGPDKRLAGPKTYLPRLL